MQAVRTYTWSFKAEAAKSQLQLLLADLAKDEWTVVKRADGEAEWQAAALNHKYGCMPSSLQSAGVLSFQLARFLQKVWG